MNILKLYLVNIDNSPGSWKSGDDPKKIVIASSEEEAMEKVKNGWGEGFNYENGVYSHTYGFGEGHNYISERTELSAIEIKFKDEDFKVISLREEKLKRITNNENEN